MTHVRRLCDTESVLEYKSDHDMVQFKFHLFRGNLHDLKNIFLKMVNYIAYENK